MRTDVVNLEHMDRIKIFRDAIWGDIGLRENEVDLVDSKPFQRLRSIKQLGLAELIYPCAKHTRFDHSLGTLFTAKLMVKRLETNLKKDENVDSRMLTLVKENFDCIRFLALLHDITHISFGHTLEDEGMLFNRHDSPESGRWEYFTEELKDTISDSIYTTLTRLYKKDFEKDNRFVHDIVANTICADLLDYIQRDAYFTGATGLRFIFDERLLRFMTLEFDENGYLRLVFKPIKDKIRIDVITDIIQLLRYRYMITERVTFHHTRCAANAMLIKAVQLLKPSGDKGKIFEKEFYWRGDDEVLTYIMNSENRHAQELGKMIKYRKLFKTVFRVTSYSALRLKEGDVKGVSIKYGNPKGREELEYELINEITQISTLNNFDKNHIAIYCPPDEHMNFKETKVLVHWRGDTPIPLNKFQAGEEWEYLIEDEVEALEKKYNALWNMHIFIHPDFKRHLYVIEKCCESVLGVPNDPLLKRSFGRSEDYRDSLEYAEILTKQETEIITTAKEVARRGVANKEEAVKEAILQNFTREEMEVEVKDADLRKRKTTQGKLK
jgi:HD superfamily phosphohydrolase